MPLLPQARRDNDENLSFAFRPSLGQQDSGFDGLAQPNFVGKDGPLRKWGSESEQGGFDLMGVQVNLSVSKGSGKLLHAVRGAPFRKLERKILCVICSTHRGVKANDTSRIASPLKAQREPFYLPQLRG